MADEETEAGNAAAGSSVKGIQPSAIHWYAEVLRGASRTGSAGEDPSGQDSENQQDRELDEKAKLEDEAKSAKIGQTRARLTKTCKLFNAPFFIEKVRDITGLYSNYISARAELLRAAERTQTQAVDRTRPILPMGLRYAEGYTHDDIRHGTTSLFAAHDAATGQVIAPCQERHCRQEWLSFLRLIDREMPDGLDIHLVCDLYITHQHAKVRAWIAKRTPFHLNLTWTYAVWLNQVERRFGRLSQRAIKRSRFRGVTELCGRFEMLMRA